MYNAALDLSGNEAVFAVQKAGNGELVINESRAMRGRTASVMAPWIMELLAQAGIDLKEISHWTVGSGPGSFTGMRLAAGFVAGLAAEKTEVKTRCIPTAIAMVYGLQCKEGDVVAAVYDGRNQEILVYPLVFSCGEFHPTGEPAVLNHEQAAEYFAGHRYSQIAALAHEIPAIDKIIELNPVSIPGIQAEGLLKATYAPFDNDLTTLVYIRPAVHIS